MDKESEAPQVQNVQDINGYFNSYNDLSVHQLMLKDRPRTLAYRNFFETHREAVKDKVVLDIGAGTGILSLFAAVELGPLSSNLNHPSASPFRLVDPCSVKSSCSRESTNICKCFSPCPTSSKRISPDQNHNDSVHRGTAERMDFTLISSCSCPPCNLCGRVVCTLPFDLCNGKCDCLPSRSPALKSSSARQACVCRKRLRKDLCVRKTMDVSPINKSCTLVNPTNLIGCESWTCETFKSYQNGQSFVQCRCLCLSSEPKNLSNVAGAFSQDSLPEVYSVVDSNCSDSKKNSIATSRWTSGLSDYLQRLKFNWKSLLIVALLLPCVLSRENLHPEQTAKPETNYSVDNFVFPNSTFNATVLPAQEKSVGPSSSQNSASPKPACKGDGCSKLPAALEGEKKSSNGQRSVHMERIKMMLIPIVTVATAAVVLVSIYCICRYKKCLCCQRQLDKCNSICDQCMRGDFGSTSATGVVIDENGEMEALDDGTVTPTPSSGEVAHIRLAVPARPGHMGRGAGKSHSAMYIFRQPSHSGSVSSSRGRLSKSLQHVESTSSHQRRVSRGSRGSLQSSSTAATLSVPPASRSDSIHRLLGGPPRTAAAASRSTSFSDSANKNQQGQQSASGGKGQTSVGNSRQSSVRSLATSAQGDGQDVPKGFIPPMRPF